MELTNNYKSFEAYRSYLLGLASKTRRIFESLQPEKKNKILRMLLANCQINEKGLQLNLLKSFSALSRTLETQNWLRQLGSNQRPIG